MKKLCFIVTLFPLILLLLASTVQAVEADKYRLLSVADSPKLILISQIPTKTKYVLDATSAKITVNGKPAEFKDLKQYVIVTVKMELRKFSKDGIEIDGTASEIRITTPQETVQQK
ncbi:MAG TPA: hypothetical protein VE398_20105 [Acidobacteriota bacterium]|nr:hypothetical protein [Acidobacteriota bacterium]